jgi:hypothetical protein
MQNTLNVPARLRYVSAALLSAIAVVACKQDGGTDPGETPLTSTRVTLDAFGVSTVKGSGGVTFVNPGRYAVIPQFAATQDFATPAGTRTSVPSFPFTLGPATGLTARVAPTTPPPANLSVVEAFHMRLRDLERKEAPGAIAYMQQLRSKPNVSARVQSAQAQVDRDFRVLSTLTGGTYTTITARLLYTGNNILLYVDNTSPTTGGFTDAEYAAFGKQFDEDLFPIDIANFGPTSDIDANGKTFVLYTPVVNRLTLNTGACGTYVAGFFNSADLNGNSTNANRAEIFYASVPGEPAGGPTCPNLSVSTVRTSAPATFIHELQHMISYNQHTLVRNSPSEAVWLNEGLSHMAEELGGKFYENLYPCPNLPPCPGPGRGSPSQIFPDLAQGFLPPNFGNAYDFFTTRQDFSLTSPTGFGTIEERGVAWLFLRWLVDQKGNAALKSLVQTTNTGTANVEAVANESFPVLFSDFLVATLLDDFPGATAGQISPRYQFTSRNLRAIYARLNTIAPTAYPTAYPLDVADLPGTAKLIPTSSVVSRTMKPGSFDLFQFTSTAGSAGLNFKPPTTATFAANLNAQVTVVRLP